MNKFPRIALCQVNATVGDLGGNASKIVDWTRRAQDKGAELIIFPELCLTGYPPKDLLLKPSFLREQRERLGEIAGAVPDVTVIVGCVDFEPRENTKGQNIFDVSAKVSARSRLYNAAAVLRGGRIERYVHKTHLPNYDVFDEERYFESPQKNATHFFGDPEKPRQGTPSSQEAIVELRGGTKAGITICEDIWVQDGPAARMKAQGASLIVNISASPFYKGKFRARVELLKTRVKEAELPLIYVNAVGGQDDLVFDGRSMVVVEKGEIAALAKGFEEELLVYSRETADKHKVESEEVAEVWKALVLGIKDYVHKNGFSQAALGVSGGIDSALVAALAVDALGAKNVLGVAMPSKYTSRQSLKDALLLCNNLGIKSEPIPIDELVASYHKTLVETMDLSKPDVTAQNIQARIRGNILMAFSNKFGYLVLATGNKSELATGYATLYGDMSGGLAPIGDVPKTLVYALARWFNAREKTDMIPVGILERAPSAELAPNQRDQDDLPPYDVLDKILEMYVEEDLSSEEIVERGFDPALVHSIIRRIDRAEYKRRQAAPILKITPRAFGFGRRMPITNKYEG